MSFRLHILGSSSAGNCSLLVTPTARILVDAGFSARRIRQGLEAVGEAVEDLDAVFVTHEHIDHCAGIRMLSKQLPRTQFFANEATAREVCDCAGAHVNWKLFETGSTFHFRDIAVSAFSIPHDAADPVAYKFCFGLDTAESPRRSLAWVTDLGYVPSLVREKIRDVEILVLEANYDAAMLENSGRPLSLKQRIRGRHGHLSNDDALELLLTLENERLRQVFLAHLSRECNTPGSVSAALASAQTVRAGCRFTVIDPAMASPLSYCGTLSE